MTSAGDTTAHSGGNPAFLWDRFRRLYWSDQRVGISLDISRMNFSTDFFELQRENAARAFAAMAELEQGAVANPDEQRMVGHYWLRAPELAPSGEIRTAIEGTLAQIRKFSTQVHRGETAPQNSAKFTDLLLIGIGGSALGPQLVADALGTSSDKLRISFLDNTDPDGIDRAITSLPDLDTTLCVVVSKSGGTRETKNSQMIVEQAYRAAGLEFGKHAVAVTGVGSGLEKTAQAGGWIAIFPMWDWVGGRTSELSAVGLLPAALQGLDIDGMLEGARLMDQLTRVAEIAQNPAMQLALMWHSAGGGVGNKAMVVLPYKDRLLLMSRYLQQLVMESIGKKESLTGEVVHQGLAVYGNKGSTDQHAYVQQLRDGRNDFFATFIEVLTDSSLDAPKNITAERIEVAPGIRSGDYLRGFCAGTRTALHESGRESLTITLDKLNARSLGALIALFERSVGLYASLVKINAYHQPGVEAGKVAAESFIALQQKILSALGQAGQPLDLAELAAAAGSPDRTEDVFRIVTALVSNGRLAAAGQAPFANRYTMVR